MRRGWVASLAIIFFGLTSSARADEVPAGRLAGRVLTLDGCTVEAPGDGYAWQYTRTDEAGAVTEVYQLKSAQKPDEALFFQVHSDVSPGLEKLVERFLNSLGSNFARNGGQVFNRSQEPTDLPQQGSLSFRVDALLHGDVRVDGFATIARGKLYQFYSVSDNKDAKGQPRRGPLLTLLGFASSFKLRDAAAVPAATAPTTPETGSNAPTDEAEQAASGLAKFTAPVIVVALLLAIGLAVLKRVRSSASVPARAPARARAPKRPVPKELAARERAAKKRVRSETGSRMEAIAEPVKLKKPRD